MREADVELMKFRLSVIGKHWVAALMCLGLLFASQMRLHAAPQPSAKFEGWFNVSQVWGGTITEKNSQLSEGQTVNLRCSATLPGGSANTLFLKYDFTTGDGSSRFFDYLGSKTVPDATLLSGLGVTGTGVDVNLPDDPGVPGDQSVGKLRVFNATITGFGPYTLVNGIKMLPVNFVVASGSQTRAVVIGHGAIWPDPRMRLPERVRRPILVHPARRMRS